MVEQMRGYPLPTTILAVEPEQLGWGTELTATLQAKVQPVIDLIWKEVYASKCSGSRAGCPAQSHDESLP